MTKNVLITIDIAIARRMLTVAGFSVDEIRGASDDEIFTKVMAMIECYGAVFRVKEG